MAMNSAVRFPVDAETAFRSTAQAAAGGAAADTTVNSGAIDLDVLSAYWEPTGELANMQEFAIFGRVTEVVSGGGTIQVQTSANGTFSDAVAIVTTPAFTAAGQFTLAVTREQLAGATKIRVSGVKANSSSGVEFWAYAAPLTRT